MYVYRLSLESFESTATQIQQAIDSCFAYLRVRWGPSCAVMRCTRHSNTRKATDFITIRLFGCDLYEVSNFSLLQPKIVQVEKADGFFFQKIEF